MLGFTTYAETPISSVGVALDANAFMAGASATTSIGIVSYDAKANITPRAVTATLVNVVPGHSNTTTQDPVTASLAVSFKGVANSTTLLGVSTAGSVGALDYDAKANITSQEVTATLSLAIEYDAQATITITGVSASVVTAPDFEDEDAQASTVLSGVYATGNATSNTVNAINVVYLNTDFERDKAINVVPYGNYKIYITEDPSALEAG